VALGLLLSLTLCAGSLFIIHPIVKEHVNELSSRYFNKMVASKQSCAQLPENISYMGHDFKLRPCPARTPDHFMDPAVQLAVYEQRARR